MNYKKLSGLAIIGTAFSLLGVSLPAQAISFSYSGNSITNIDSPGASDTITVTDTGIIEELFVDVELENKDGQPELFWTDLDISLSHDGTTVSLNNGVSRSTPPSGVSLGIFNVSFSDTAASHLSPNGGNAMGPFSPEKPLLFNAFAGAELSGDWELMINDSVFGGNQDNLVSWSISGTTNSAAVPFEFSPGLGLFMVSGLFLGKYWRKQKKERPSLK
ncbi:MAG: hypothetical protein AB4368_31480 [Xenococcaceae cyanobacterium]